MGVLEFIAVVALYLEIAVLAFCDYKLWRTMYTPLNLLMLPYAVILFITLLSCGNMGIVEFYYPSLMIWMIGLIIFAVPGFIFGVSFRRKIAIMNIGYVREDVNMKVLDIASTLLVVMFLIRFVLMLRSSSHLPGSEQFGYEYCGSGVWGHLHRVLHALSIIYIYKYDKNHKYCLLLIAGMYFVTLMYGVKSWVLIPGMAGICMRLYAGKLKLNLSLFLKVMIFAFAVFFVTYTFSLFLGKKDAAAFNLIFEIICKKFVHYVISGIVGWSQDLQMGILETPRFDTLLTNIMNLYNVVVGYEFVDPVNPHFIYNGVSGSNVRAFFGTIYINSNLAQFVIMVLMVSAIHYIVMLCAMKNRSIYLYTVYFFYGGMLLMGWFEIYFYHLQFLEVPAWVFILYLVSKKKTDDTQVTPTIK